MKIAHFAPFAPIRCGMYEAARDMARADCESGHYVYFVDVGVTVGGTHEEGKPGQVDDKAGFRLETVPFEMALDADVFVHHTGTSDNWVVRSQAPMVWIVHGRPLACFRPEQNRVPTNAYSLIGHLATWPRTKKMITFWPTFASFWRVIVPEEKLAVLDWPGFDRKRYTPEGQRHQFDPKDEGLWNCLIADSWREDVDVYEIAHGALEAAKRLVGLKVHFYAMEFPLGPWEPILAAFRKIGALGEVRGRMPNMEEVYRAMDFVLTPHNIVTRIVGEAICCGVPVIGGPCAAYTAWRADPSQPDYVAGEIERMCQRGTNASDAAHAVVKEQAELFDLKPFGRKMTAIYEAAVDRRPRLRIVDKAAEATDGKAAIPTAITEVGNAANR